MNTTSFVAPALESALNAYLRMDPDTECRMQDIDGRVVAFRLTDLDLILYFIPSLGHMSVKTHCDMEPEVMISGSLSTLIRMGLSSETGNGVSVKNVEIRGDIELGKALYELLTRVEIEWEELLANRVGDIAAHQIGNLARDFTGWIGQVREALRMDFSEYLQEESRIVPAKPEIETFLDGVDTLRSDVDRLQARVERLESRLGMSSGSAAESDKDSHGA